MASEGLGTARRPEAQVNISRRMRVLLVDDDPLVLHALAELLRLAADVTAAADPLVGLALLAAGRFDAVITDYNMPYTNGVSFLREVSRGHPWVRRVLASGGEVPALQGHLASGLVHAFVVKPSTYDELCVALDLC